MAKANSSLVTRFIAAILFAYCCCFANQSIADGKFHKRGWHFHRISPAGWGWDSRSGWYAGPFFGRTGHGYFRCFDPGYGWHACPHYLPASAAPKPPRRWWRWHFIVPGPSTLGERYRGGGPGPIATTNTSKIRAGSEQDLIPPPTAPPLSTTPTGNAVTPISPPSKTEPSPQAPEVAPPPAPPTPSPQAPEGAPPPAPPTPGPQAPEGAPPPAPPTPSPQAPEIQLGVTASEIHDVMKGWSVKRTILDQPVYNEEDERVGSVDDIIVTADKAISDAIINAGGFLGLTKHNVAIPVSQFKLVDNKLVLPGATKETLKASPELRDVANGWSIKRTILGQPVYNDKNERVGSVDDIIVTPEKALSYGIINAGGFLGLTKHNVAIPVSQFKLVDNKLVLPGATKKALRASPEFQYAR